MTESIEQLEVLVATAGSAVDLAASIAERDGTRPGYHFRAPAQWMDDPNGIIFHDGWYHMMYSLNPHSSEQRAGMVYKTAVRIWDPASEDWTGGITVWGHARSRDLVHWEHLPIAIHPSVRAGEHFSWFGCTVITDLGQPLAIYTAVGPELRPEDSAQQWAAVGSPDLMDWTPVPGNPVVGYDIHGGETITEWRDPFLFQADGVTFMVIGGQDVGGQPVVALYEAASPDFLSWTYRGIVFRYPDATFPSAECPNLFRLGDQWVLMLSPHGPVEYFIGDFDPKAGSFDWRSRGIVDHSANFYASNVLRDDQDRWIMWGAVEGFTENVGWNGCVSLPRTLTIEGDRLIQRVVPELEQLRTQQVTAQFELSAERTVVSQTESSGTLELFATLRGDGSGVVVFDLVGDEGAIQVGLGPDSLRIDEREFPIRRASGDTEVRVFLDRTVLEVYIDGSDVATCVIPHITGSLSVHATARSSHPVYAEVSTWAINMDELFTGSVLRRPE